jgi:acetoin utilization deacetylase AcuC-like enzyme
MAALICGRKATVTSTAFITHRDCHLHDMGSYHPETPERLNAISDHLIAQGLDSYFAYHEAPAATFQQLRRVHTAAHLEHLKRASPELGIVHLDPDTAMNRHTWQAALRAAGAGVLAVDLVMAGTVENAFCAVRPPGHHAERSAAMGFCFFNNIAVAAAHALAVHQLSRVAIVDFDVHHGNGTEDCFRANPRVLMVSTFQHPFYPYSGTERPSANMLNVPLGRGADGEEFRHVVSDLWMPRLREFRPEMLFISAGFDAHFEDEMGGLRLLEKDYAWVTEQIKLIADESAQGRIVSMLEGGYSLSALARSVAVHLRVLAEL